MSLNLELRSDGDGVRFDEISWLDDGGEYEDEWEKFGGVERENEEDYAGEYFDMNEKVFEPMESIKEEVEGSIVSSTDIAFRGMGANVVYVAVWKQSLEASMDALKWALSNMMIPSYTVVLLIHVFPQTKYIPTLLGNLPVSQVNPEQKKNYMDHERFKRRELLKKYLDVCSKSQVKADTIFVESDREAKAILDLIPILNIRKLVLGITKSTARRLRSKKGKGVTEEIVQNAPEFCDVKLICEGKEMLSELKTMDISSPSSSPVAAKSSTTEQQENALA